VATIFNDRSIHSEDNWEFGGTILVTLVPFNSDHSTGNRCRIGESFGCARRGLRWGCMRRSTGGGASNDEVVIAGAG